MTGNPLIREKAWPSTSIYWKVALVLFALTALEVAAFEVAHRDIATLTAIVAPILIPILILLSAMKFALVAAFYMHLKQDSIFFSGLFVFPILIAGGLILALLALFSYARTFAAGG